MAVYKHWPFIQPCLYFHILPFSLEFSCVFVFSYTLIGHNDYSQAAKSSEGVYTFNVPDKDQISVQRGDIIGINSGGDARVIIPHQGCPAVSMLYK